jgi:hypothetical protein
MYTYVWQLDYENKVRYYIVIHQRQFCILATLLESILSCKDVADYNF